MKAWVTLGYFDDRGDGAVIELDASSGLSREVMHFDAPVGLRVPAKGFTGACWSGSAGSSDLLVCGPAAVFRFDRDLRHAGTLALPSFNDLHGVHCSGDRMYVVNTGLDCVDIFDLQGCFVGSHSFEAAWLMGPRQRGDTPTRDDWHRLHGIGWRGEGYAFDAAKPGESYYRGVQTEPFHVRQQRDYVHPNHVCVLDGRVMVTSLVRRGVIDITNWRQVVTVDSPPHDGLVRDGGFYMTRVDGYVERRDTKALGEAGLITDVTALSGVSGWCRGIHLDDDLLWVGFTAIRSKPGHPWDRGDFASTSTSVVALDRRSGAVVRIFDFADAGRHSKVFAILEAG
jgi:hypothetical protein